MHSRKKVRAGERETSGRGAVGVCLLGFLLSLLFMGAAVGGKGGDGPALGYEHRTTGEPLSIHILEVDPAGYRIVAARANDQGLGRERVSSLARRKGAIAAVNGGFFTMGGKFDGLPVGVLKIEDRWFSTTRNRRAALGWSEGSAVVLMERLDMRWWVEVGGESLPVDGLNQPRSRNNRIVYTPDFNMTTLAGGGGIELLVRNGEVVDALRQGDAPIPREGFVYSIGSGLASEINPPKTGEKARLRKSFHSARVDFEEDPAWQGMDYILGGTPLLLRDGLTVSDFEAERVQDGFLEKKHPRTAVGIRPDGRWVFVVVDGRRPVHSVGMTMEELAELMRELGCEQAINLDGGGSSTFYLYGSVLNLPSDLIGERPVSDAILILPID